MKINWGTGIVIAFIGFIGFILYFVIQASADPRAEHDMVTDSYYKKELEYQQELNASANLKASGGGVTVRRLPDGLAIRLPEQMDPAAIRGTIGMYRPSDDNLDFEWPIQPGDSLQRIPSDRLVEGRWDLRIDWEYHGEKYLYRTRLTY
ncbi:FixH family protein [Robiginitalea biformata]|uniref:FixH family protein n=1 Tax=Robiginitalea biformata TaxID=252307 RepID=UPI003B5AF8BC